MQKYLCFLLILFLSGCATTKQPELPPVIEATEETVIEPVAVVKPSVFLPLVKKDPVEEKDEDVIEEIPMGIVFARTSFEGVLQTEYVKLLIESITDPEYKFQLHIGEKLAQQDVAYEIKNVRSDFFYLELPAGEYRIAEVAIPVGSTLATETTDISFYVDAAKASYIGNLKMVGTKERIKLGGVPVIKPGFEYKIEIIDAEEASITAFERNFPENELPIEKNLMIVHQNRGEKK